VSLLNPGELFLQRLSGFGLGGSSSSLERDPPLALSLCFRFGELGRPDLLSLSPGGFQLLGQLRFGFRAHPGELRLELRRCLSFGGSACVSRCPLAQSLSFDL
jgi:hypothetical protein